MAHWTLLAAGALLILTDQPKSMAGEPSPKPPSFVGCQSDGQQGPQPAPKTAMLPHLQSKAASRLAYYAGPDVGVLAPIGWHCLELEGSNGITLIVSPDKPSFRHFSQMKRLRGDGVVFTYENGGTSGRWGVARIAGGIFPAARKFVSEVNAMFPATPVRPIRVAQTDHIAKRTSTRIEFTTPAGHQGLGTEWPLPVASRPVRGSVQIFPDQDMDMAMLQVRVPSRMTDLTDTIVEQTARSLAAKR